MAQTKRKRRKEPAVPRRLQRFIAEKEAEGRLLDLELTKHLVREQRRQQKISKAINQRPYQKVYVA